METPFDLPADLDTPVSAYKKLGPLEPRFLLESVVGGERESRYSFLGFGPAKRVVFDRRGFYIDGQLQCSPTNAHELKEALRTALDRSPLLAPGLPQLPFRGGLVGATGYGLAGFLEGLDFERRDPGVPLLSLLSPGALLVFDHLTRRVALLVDGDERARKSLRREVVRLLAGPLPRGPFDRGLYDDGAGGARPGFVGPATESLPKAAFEEAARLAQEDIHAGELYQLVLSSRFEGEADVDPLSVYRALRLSNPSPYMFLMELDGETLVGSSPEALIRLEGRRAELRPIAGTRPRGANEKLDRALAEELAADPKEAAEHVMLVDLARNDLGRVAIPGSVRVEPFRTIERYSHVMHLVSGVQGVIEPDKDAFDLFCAALPAGTVSGAPKVRALQRIDELEPVPRGFYAGAVGFFGHGGTAEQAIAIRTISLKEGRYSYQAGAGIVADSVPSAEHDEVLAKARAMRDALTMASEELSRCAS